MTLTLIFVALTLLSAIHILQVKHLMRVIRSASTFLAQVHEKFIQHPDYAQQTLNATADILTLRDYYSSISMYSMIALSIFPLNVLGIVSAEFQDMTSLHMLIAICDSLIILNTYKMWQKMMQIDAVCTDYNIVLQSMRYIEIEPKENQKDG